jgi:signal transduction histidine kinase
MALRSMRRLLLVAAGVYLAWWFVVRAVLPDSFNPLASRLVAVATFLLAYAASYGSPRLRRHLELLFNACAWILTLHYYYLFDGNHGDMPWAVGAYVVVVAVSACLSSRGALLAYSALTMALGVLVALDARALWGTIFLPGLLTMVLLSNFTLHSRLMLERERAERERAEAARALAEAGIALRDEFISIASHELRTPLSALQLGVQGLSRAVQRGVAGKGGDSLARYIDVCQRQTVRFGRLVDRLLDASQMTDGGLTLQPEEVSLMELTREVAQAFAADAAAKGSSIEVAGSSNVAGHWDRTRLEQVVSNLLRNALTFGLGRPIHVTVSAEGDVARLAVADEGIGIPREDQARIFGRFERAVSSRNYGGMGLGLYVVSTIVQAHGGKVCVESEPGKGATFIVQLPAA